MKMKAFEYKLKECWFYEVDDLSYCIVCTYDFLAMGIKKGDPWRCAKGPRLNTIKIDNYIELFHFHVHIGEVLRIYIIVANDGIIF